MDGALAEAAQDEHGGRPFADRVITPAPLDFAAIYEAEVGYLWNLLRRLGVAERELEDRVHDVFVVAYRRREDFDATRSMRAWLGGIAVRVAADARRREGRRKEVLQDNTDELRDERPTVEQQIDRRREQTLVACALDQLGEPQRVVFVLHDIEGHSMPEIAAMVEAPLNTLYSRLRLARQHFAEALAQMTVGRGQR